MAKCPCYHAIFIEEWKPLSTIAAISAKNPEMKKTENVKN